MPVRAAESESFSQCVILVESKECNEHQMIAAVEFSSRLRMS
jgi:hypothetical protein